MVGLHLQWFITAAFLLAITPGPAVIYIVTRSVTQGRAAGIASCMGVAVGGLVHVVAAAIGVSAVLATSALAFSAVKLAGAAYLVSLGIQKLLQSSDQSAVLNPAPASLARVFQDGIMVSVLNPKTALFFLAFLPQFVTPARGHIPLQLAALGSVYVVIAACTDTSWAFVASRARVWLKRHPRTLGSARYVSGGVYLTLGLATAASGHGRK